MRSMSYEAVQPEQRAPRHDFPAAGTLEDSQRLEPMAHIWVKRKQPWVLLGNDIPAFDESPTQEQFEAAIALADARGRTRLKQSPA